MGLGEPVTPIFPHGDYCSGITGSISILLALLRRGETGGSFTVDLALNYYNAWLIRSVGTYPSEVFDLGITA
jgi:crotonobetainyl-CoA:carnitine CoA-transferase CaiB-like acyl-CoA transferase